jgi:decaprenyl-phosphate phosphoribosyltransferase
MPDAPPVSRRPLARALLVEARPKQWVKNLLVFAAPAAAGVLDQRTALVNTIAAFACFCLAASGTYFLNDAADIEADRLHPKKRLRPIAAGEISLEMARVLGVAMILGSVAAAWAVNWHLAVVIASYVALTTTYSLWMKHVAVLDIVGVAAGFVLRTIAGAAAVDVPISDWFFIVVTFGSLLMVVGKRRAELEEMGADAAEFRPTLGVYPTDYLAHIQTVCTAVVLVGYCLWAFATAAEATARIPWFELSIVPFGVGVLRYTLLLDTGHGGAPEDVVLSDRPLLIMGGLWLLIYTIGVYAA